MSGERESWSRRSAIAGTVIVALVVLLSLLSVNTFPSVTNDAAVYIAYSRDLIGGGWVEQGFRQVVYPVFLAGVRGLARLVGAEPLLATAVLQRLLSVAAGVLAFRAWRWWSLPLLVYLFAPATIAYSNFLLIESLALPLAVLLVFPTLRYLRDVGNEPSPELDRRLLVSGGLATLGALFLFGLRFTFAVFGAIPLVMALAGWKTGHRRLGVSLLAVFLVTAGALTVAFTLENRAEWGVATPSAQAGHAEYYYAWLHVFREVPENREDPSLARFYDDGEVYDFERELTFADVPRAERDERFEAEIAAMLDAAGMSKTGSQLESMAWSLAGGRLHDLAGGVFGIVHSTRTDIDRWINISSFAVKNGPVAFADEYNDGLVPQAVITDPLGLPLPGPDSQSWAMLLVPLSLVITVIGLRWQRTRWTSVAGLLVVVSTAMGLGLIRADNFRFLMVSSAFGIAAATAVAPEIFRRIREPKATIPLTAMGTS
jgi:hypothetical protein